MILFVNNINIAGFVSAQQQCKLNKRSIQRCAQRFAIHILRNRQRVFRVKNLVKHCKVVEKVQIIHHKDVFREKTLDHFARRKLADQFAVSIHHRQKSPMGFAENIKRLRERCIGFQITVNRAHHIFGTDHRPQCHIA